MSKHQLKTNRHIGVNPNLEQTKASNKKIITPNTILSFGKFKGLKASEAHKINRAYFWWLKQNTNYIIVSELLPAPNKG